MTGPGSLEAFLGQLHGASTVEELWGVLVPWHGLWSSTQWDEAYALFHRFHAEEPDGAVVTAALLCTDTRWRKVSHHLVERLAGSGRLTVTDLRRLAGWFVAPSFPVEVGVVVEDLDGPGEVLAARPGGSSDQPPRRAPATSGVRLVDRSIWPPLRRWAARHQVAEDANRWRGLLDAAAAMPSRDAAALTAGVMDAADRIPLPERALAVEAGLGSGSGVVRLAALPAWAALEGPEAALARAATDPSAKVRAWTPMVPPGAASLTAQPDGLMKPRPAAATSQASLF